jgi:hypothetical protein
MNIELNQNPPKKEEIIDQFEKLNESLNAYLTNWKKNGGGTTGHAIGSAIKNTEKLKKFFNAYC